MLLQTAIVSSLIMTGQTLPDSAHTPGYVQQLLRTYRFLDRYKERRQMSLPLDPERFNEMEDFLWAFFQNCWHVKDWIRHDESLGNDLRRRVWDDIQKHQSLLIVADVANGTKHFASKPNLEWVGADSKQICITPNSDGTLFIAHEIGLKDGTRISASEAADRAMEAWREILQRHDMHSIAESPAS